MERFTTRVRQREDGWAAECALPCGWVSRGWSTRKLARARLDQHEAEHESGEPAPELEAFRVQHGLTQPPAKPVFPGDGEG